MKGLGALMKLSSSRRMNIKFAVLASFHCQDEVFVVNGASGLSALGLETCFSKELVREWTWVNEHTVGKRRDNALVLPGKLV